MATAPPPLTDVTATKSVDSSLWWDSFSHLLTDLEHSSLSSDLPPNLVKKLTENHLWFVDTVSRFKPPNEKSREALNSRQVNAGSHQLIVKPELKEAVLKISLVLCLDEIQAYILVERLIEQKIIAADFDVHEVLHVIILQYYIERQCLLKCTRLLIVHSLNTGTPQEGIMVREQCQKLISGGIENRLLLVLKDLLSSSYPDHMDADLFSLWAEETLIEDNLVLDIFFLLYYESYCTCSGKQWKEWCSIYEMIVTGLFNFEKLAISTEAMQYIYLAKVQLLLILIETLDMENLLQMVHDGTPFRPGSASFSLSDIQDVDTIMSNFNAFEVKEAGPLILAWAVFLCLISSLPKTPQTDILMDIDHVAYVRQSFEAAALNSILEILQSDVLKNSDVPIAGYQSVLRTFVSAFIASYEISLQLEDTTLILILGIICKIYQGEESLCMQFWDRDSFIDGPIRCLLCNLEGEFPYRTVELVRLLSALCEGPWPAECVYNFLDKSVGISSLFEISNDSIIDKDSQIVETPLPLHIPDVEGLLIPCNTRGHVVKVIKGNTVLVRWEYSQSGVLVLLLRLAQKLYLDNAEEVLATLDLLSRLVSSNMAICFNMLKMGNSINTEITYMNWQTDKSGSVNVVDIICTLVKKIPPDCSGALMMSSSVNILAKMLRCLPSYVIAAVVNMNIFDVALKTNPFNVRFDGVSSGSWLLSGRLANMLLIDCEHNDSCCSLTLSVLEFTTQLLETGVENDVVLALLVFSLQYVFVNHENWKYKVKHARWKVTLKLLEVMKKCISSAPYCEKLGEIVRDLLFCDSSIHNCLFRIVCTTSQDLEKFYVSRHYEMMEIEGLQLAICAALDILYSMLSNLYQELFPSLPVFHQEVLSSSTKPIPIINSMISMISCFRCPEIQVRAAKVLSSLFVLADSSQSLISGNACFGMDEKQITFLRHSINSILLESSSSNEDLFVAILNMLSSAAHYQPAFFVALIASKGNSNDPLSYVNGVKQPNEADGLFSGSMEANAMAAIVKHIMHSADLIDSKPHILLCMLNLLEGLWQGAAQFNNILDWLRDSDLFWKHVSNILRSAGTENGLIRNSREMDVQSVAYRCQCQSAVMQVLAYELFLQKKLILANRKIENKDPIMKPKDASLLSLKDALLTLYESSVSSNLIKSYASCGYDNNTYFRGKSAAGLLFVHIMEKLKAGYIGSLSVSLTGKIYSLLGKLTELPAFSELVSQYAKRGYSEGSKLHCLILHDLYYHLEGEFEGREVAPGPFKELCQYIIQSELLKVYQHKYDGDLFVHGEVVYLFDLSRFRADLGLDMWDYSEWQASKALVETMLNCLEDVNSMFLLTSSNLSSLKSLTTLFITIMEDSGEHGVIIGTGIPKQLIISSVDRVCQCLQATTDSLGPCPDASEDIINFIETQAELLLHFIKHADKKMPSSACVLILRTSGSSLKVLSDLRAFLLGTKHAIKLLLIIFLFAIKLDCASSGSSGVVEMERVDAFDNASSLSLGLLPILCNCMESDEHCTLSLTIIDFILRGFTMPNSWLPILKKHLNLQHLILKLRDRSSLAPIILKFLLTLARVRDGASMLFTAGFLPSFNMLFDEFSEGNSILAVKSKKNECIWGLGLAIIAAMIHSLQDTTSCSDIVDYVIAYFFLEKVELIYYYLTTLEHTASNEKRTRSYKTPTSLSALIDKENTLMLICELAKHRNSWMKSMKHTDSELRERSIHLLAFISRGNTTFKENPALVCQPTLKEEIEMSKKPSFVNSKRGWFAFSSLGCGATLMVSSVSSKTTALLVKDFGSQSVDPTTQTYFSDAVAIQIYRIALLILRFLCIQAESAVRRANEVGFVDLNHFPELPMPEILHGLQDQGISIVTELCEANKMKQVPHEVQSVCLLLLQITEMSLYLEFCVSQICGIGPVSGYVEDLAKKLRFLFKATEGHTFLKGPVQSLENIISYSYPGLLQTEGFFL